MFGKIVYYDKETVEEYKSIINKQRQLEIEEYEVSNDKGAHVDLKAVSADAKASKKYVARVVNSQLYDCVEFEELLMGRDDYFDFTETDNYDLATVPRGSIIKANAYLEIPESFDIVQVIDQFKPLIIDSLDTDVTEQNSKEALKSYFEEAKATKIPLICEVDEALLCAKIHPKNLLTEYEEFEELEEEVTVLARVSTGTVASNKPFFDPLKDFMKINRMMRRSMENRGNELNLITVDKAYRMIDILAIYR